MAHEEKRAWITLVVSIVGYAVYALVVLGRMGDGPVADTPYIGVLLWTVGSAVVAAIVGDIAAAMISGERVKTDQRDREVLRFSEHVGNSLVVIAAVAALVLAMAEAAHFWIANAVYLGFFLSAVIESLTRIASYRRGLPW